MDRFEVFLKLEVIVFVKMIDKGLRGKKATVLTSRFWI